MQIMLKSGGGVHKAESSYNRLKKQTLFNAIFYIVWSKGLNRSFSPDGSSVNSFSHQMAVLEHHVHGWAVPEPSGENGINWLVWGKY